MEATPTAALPIIVSTTRRERFMMGPFIFSGDPRRSGRAKAVISRHHVCEENTSGRNIIRRPRS